MITTVLAGPENHMTDASADEATTLLQAHAWVPHQRTLVLIATIALLSGVGMTACAWLTALPLKDAASAAILVACIAFCAWALAPLWTRDTTLENLDVARTLANTAGTTLLLTYQRILPRLERRSTWRRTFAYIAFVAALLATRVDAPSTWAWATLASAILGGAALWAQLRYDAERRQALLVQAALVMIASRESGTDGPNTRG